MRRLYLDTSDLLDIADGRIAPNVVDELTSALVDTQTRVVITREHVHDAVVRASAASRERFVSAVERFGVVAVVLDDALDIEPHQPGRDDVVVAECTNFRELVFSDSAQSWLRASATLADAIHVGNVSAQARLIDEAQAPPSSRAAQELFTQCFITLWRGWMGDSPSEVLPHWEQKLGLSLREDERRIGDASP